MSLITPFQTADGKRAYQLQNPASLESIGEFTVTSPQQVGAVVGAAKVAQAGWAALGYAGRAACLDRLRAVLIARQDKIVETIVMETGKAPMEALAEVIAALDSLQYYAKHGSKILNPKTRRAHLFWPFKKLYMHYQPLGVVGVITPWNFPFATGMNPSIQALISGNTVVLKPSEVTPLSGLLIGELVREAGFPAAVFEVVAGDAETGSALTAAAVDKIHFTGSVATGRKIGEVCGRRLVPCTLELGGKDPAIVCSDANLERAVAGVVNGAFFNTGQACASTERVYVMEDIADRFIAAVKVEVENMRQSSTGEFDVGPMIWDKQLEIVERQVNEAINDGATLLCGGKRKTGEAGLFYEPTVLTGVNHTMAIMTEETFGPVLPIMRVRNEQEALQLANDSRYGLSGSIWCGDLARGTVLAKQIRSGGCSVNEFGGVVYGAAEGSFGGRQESGIGRINGEAGLKSFCCLQTIVIHQRGPQREQQWFPYQMKSVEGMKKFIKIMWGTRLGRWLA